MNKSLSRSIYTWERFIKNMLFFTVFLLTTFIHSIPSLYGQQNIELHKRSIIQKTEEWKPGKINDTRHVVDSFFYADGILREVAESIIKRKHFCIVDSIPVNNRKLWNKNGQLVLNEHFSNGRIIEIKNNYSPLINIIQNGSFEVHSKIPKHKTTKIYAPRIRCNPVESIIKTDTIHIQPNENDEVTKFILYTKETVSNCENDYSKMVQKYVLIKKNGETIDSIYVGMPVFIHKGHYSDNKLHDCNYETIKIKVNNWKSLGQAYPNIYDLENSAPVHPLNGLADSIFYFEPIAGNSFVKLSAFQYSMVDCNPWMAHPLLQNKLATTLEKGKIYHLEFWLWKPEIYPENRPLKVCFSQEPIGINNYKKFSRYAITLPAFNDSIVHQWQKISLTLEATEYARFMTIGFFDFEKDNIPVTPNDRISRWCYVDGFILSEEPYKHKVRSNFYPDSLEFSLSYSVDTTKNAPLVFDEKIINKNQPIILENVYFPKDEYTIKDNSIPQLQKLVQLLKNNPQINIEISGHTDNEGSAKYNQILSEKRALSIVAYLKTNGISANRISWQGHGDKQPISKNTSVKGRALNRRVEFLIKKNGQE